MPVNVFVPWIAKHSTKVILIELVFDILLVHVL